MCVIVRVCVHVCECVFVRVCAFVCLCVCARFIKIISSYLFAY